MSETGQAMMKDGIRRTVNGLREQYLSLRSLRLGERIKVDRDSAVGGGRLDRILIEGVGADVLFVWPGDSTADRAGTFEISNVLQLAEDAEFEKVTAIIDTYLAVCEGYLECIVVSRFDLFDSRVHGHLSGSILNGC